MYRIIILILLSINLNAQDSIKIIKYTPYIKYTSSILGGVCEGLREASKFYGDKLPNINPENSWRNKYKNGDPNQGERFLGSTTIFSGLTDNYHLLGSVRTLSGISYTSSLSIEFYHFKANRRVFYKKLIKDLLINFILYNGFKTIIMEYYWK